MIRLTASQLFVLTQANMLQILQQQGVQWNVSLQCFVLRQSTRLFKSVKVKSPLTVDLLCV